MKPNLIYALLLMAWLLTPGMISYSQTKSPTKQTLRSGAENMKLRRGLKYKQLVHVGNRQQFGFGGGYVINGFNTNIMYAQYLDKRFMFRTDFYYENMKIALSQLNLFYLSPELNYTVKKVNSWLFFNVKAGLLIGNENFTNKVLINKAQNKIIWGEKIGLKTEIFFQPQWSLNIDIEQRIFNNSQIGNWSGLCALSVAYNF